MAHADYRSARGSNAGDDFHELWVLRQALALLDQDTELTAIAVEGLSAEDESGAPSDTWDGVDCAFYFGGDQAASAKRIVIDQVKYSAANPEQAWTVARLTHSSNRRGNNSVVGRLTKAFVGVSSIRPDLVADGKVTVRLVSNQQVDPAVLSALAARSGLGEPPNGKSAHQADRADLQAASGLNNDDFDAFVRCLDLSECGCGSRLALEERIVTTISQWTDEDARVTVANLLHHVRRAMMPEAKGEVITCQWILAKLGVSHPGALFPCPAQTMRVERVVPREVSRAVVERLCNGDQRILLHGEAGCGKTTVLQELGTLLPHGSVVIIFDCYGSGRYLDSDAYRHRPRDAFLQLSNDLARRLRIPLLVSPSGNLDYPKAFKKRLERAAEVVAADAQDALLVVAVDAADNAVAAASTQSPPDRCFVHDFASLGSLPDNVRFIVTSRTGRLSALESKLRDFIPIEATGFTRDETAAHVRGIWGDAPDDWIDDLHHLSNHNPRVQRYALDYAGTELASAIEYLLPNGKVLDQVFKERLEQGRRKVGIDQDIKLFCAGVIALPRPVPISSLSEVTGLRQDHIRDLCADLAPGVRLTGGLIGFADEDFEHFIRSEADTELEAIRERIADYFSSRHQSDAYAATHIAAALFAAGRAQEMLELVRSGHEPTAIGDPVLRREVQLQRHRIAMKVCRENGNNVDAILTLLSGAEALKTEAAIRRTLVENSDLAACFARDTSSRIVLRDPNEIKNHGPLLLHLMAADARDGDGIPVRGRHRQFRAWLQRRAEDYEQQQRTYPGFQPQGWSISDRDIAAETEAVLRISGPRSALENLLRWRPRTVALRTASILSYKLIISGEAPLVERCVTEAHIRTPWDLFLLTPLALSGREVDLPRLEVGLASLLRRELIRPDQLRDSWYDDNASAEYFDTILTACEVVVARGGNRESVVPVLERLADRESRRRNRLSTAQVSVLDLSLRSHALLERLAGRKATLETYWVDPPDPSAELPAREAEQLKRSDSEKKEELQAFIAPLIAIYDIRAQALIGSISSADVDAEIRNAIAHYHGDDYRISRDFHAHAMRRRAALSITLLTAIQGLDSSVLLRHADSLLGARLGPLGSTEAPIFASLALDRSLHPQILDAIAARARAVKGMRISTEDKLTALVDFARLLLPISYADAQSLFNDAIEVAGGVNSEAVHEIALFAPLVERAVGSMGVEQRRAVARDFAIVVGDAGVRLEGSDGFPWAKAAQALTTLDVSFALAATARWEDSSIVGHDTFLPYVLETALSDGQLSPSEVVALFSLLDHSNVELIARTVYKASRRNDGLDLKVLSEELARDELLRFGQGRRPGVSDHLRSLLAKDDPGYWLNLLIKATAFHQIAAASHADAAQDGERLRHRRENDQERSDPLSSIDWAAHSFSTANDIDSIVGHAREAAPMDTYLPISAIFDRMRGVIQLGDRVAHLEALIHSESQQVPDYELAQAIVKCVDDWGETPSVNRWSQEGLLRAVVELLPGFSRELTIGVSPLPGLLEKSKIPDHQICAALLEGMERHVDALNAPTVYALVGLVGRYCAPDDAARVVVRYADKLVQRVPACDRDCWDLGDIPEEGAGGVARLLFALMGDVNVRIRWRAAHAVRRLARFGDTGILDRLVELWDRTSEPSYRRPDAPFYWLAARLWLVMALDRITAEAPSIVGRHGRWLLAIAVDEEFPHVLVRSFAKSAISKLVESGHLSLDPGEREAFLGINASPIGRGETGRSPRVDFDRYAYRQRRGRRFDFDPMDTLPYWYTRVLEAFVDVSEEELLDVAERWIVDRWGVRDNPWAWVDEPRKDRLSDRSSSSMDHRHGSRPTLERFHTYLEWHAMCCAMGELMRTRALAGEDDYDSFEHWLSRECLTMPPLWLADLRSLKPLEDWLWYPPQGDIDVWLESASNDGFFAELVRVSDSRMIVVGGHHDTRSGDFMLSERVETALVSPDTASALVRALQTVDDSSDYRLPPAGDNLEIDSAPYKLVGWLLDVEHQSGIDEHDPLRYEVRAVECCPADQVTRALTLDLHYGNPVGWIARGSGDTVFVYEAWGDNRGDEQEDRFRYDKTVRSSGWRLRADKEALRAFLNEMGLDLVVEVEVTRRNKGYGYSRYDEKGTKEVGFDKVILLRRDGTVEDAERRLGTWTAPRP